MAGPTLTEVRAALAETLQARLPELVVYSEVEDLGELPAVIIEPQQADFEGAFQNGLHTWEFSLFVLTRRNDEVSGQQELDKYISGFGPESIRQVIYDHSELGTNGEVEADVYAMKGYGGSFEWAGVRHVGAILKARVYTSNK